MQHVTTHVEPFFDEDDAMFALIGFQNMKKVQYVESF